MHEWIYYLEGDHAAANEKEEPASSLLQPSPSDRDRTEDVKALLRRKTQTLTIISDTVSTQCFYFYFVLTVSRFPSFVFSKQATRDTCFLQAKRIKQTINI